MDMIGAFSSANLKHERIFVVEEKKSKQKMNSLSLVPHNVNFKV